MRLLQLVAVLLCAAVCLLVAAAVALIMLLKVRRLHDGAPGSDLGSITGVWDEMR